VRVTAFRYVVRTRNKGRTYYHFRRRPFPIVRLPGEPGSVLFTDTYTAALRATNLEGFTALRKHMQGQRSRRPDSPSTQILSPTSEARLYLSSTTYVGVTAF